nr:DUF2256 domain-containing protein [Aurantimonas sp. VKM B-3413]
MRRKSDLPTKICAACGRPMVWRRKWKAVWDEVRYCSDRCRREARRAGPARNEPRGSVETPLSARRKPGADTDPFAQ